MQLDLIEISEKNSDKKRFFAVNDRHYDAMLACGGSELEANYPWQWLGTVEISEEILNEQGYFHVDDTDDDCD